MPSGPAPEDDAPTRFQGVAPTAHTAVPEPGDPEPFLTVEQGPAGCCELLRKVLAPLRQQRRAGRYQSRGASKALYYLVIEDLADPYRIEYVLCIWDKAYSCLYLEAV